MTVKVIPATVIVPVRALSVLGATVKLKEPLPVPELPLVIVIHGTLLTAVQEQVVGSLLIRKTPTVSLPPVAG